MLDEFVQLEAGKPLHQQPDGAIWRAEHAVDDRNRADVIQIIRTGVFQFGIFRGDQADQLIAGHGIIDQANRARLANGQRDGGLRVNHQPAQRQDGQLVGDIFWRGSASSISVERISVDSSTSSSVNFSIIHNLSL